MSPRTRNLPDYVRLPAEGDVLPIGILADVEGGSGWSISGLDVKEVPAEGEEGYDFVRTALNQGRLEPSSKAEFDTVQAGYEEVASKHPVTPPGEQAPPWNEPAIAKTSKAIRKRLVEGRRSGEFPTEESDDEDAEKAKAETRANNRPGRGVQGQHGA